MEIVQNDGKKRVIVISKFSALDGWDIQSEFVRFAASSDKDFRRAFTVRVLGYAKILIETNEFPLVTDAMVDNHLQKWENVEAVFNAVLKENGIEAETHAMQTKFWSEAGAEIATSFIAEVTALIGPSLQFNPLK